VKKLIKGFKEANVYLPGQGIVKTSITWKDGKINEIKPEISDDLVKLPDNLFVVPGFIDKHIHGANNSDSMYPHFEDILNIAKTIASEGVTSFLATTMTQSEENITNALIALREYIEKDPKEGAQVLGIHLEGPFINPKYKGAQLESCIVKCDLETFKRYEEASGNHIMQVTLAYEQDGKELVEYLASKGIVASLGHTNATSAQVKEAAEKGATSVTHVYNAMSPLHHREAGVVGGAFVTDSLYCELIADLVHVCADAIDILFRCKGKDKVVLVTDGIEAKHLDDGVYLLGGQEVFVNNGVARLQSGALAGSTLKLNEGIRNILSILPRLSFTDAIDLATINPARNLGVDHYKGMIKEGYDADLVVIDKDINVYMTINRGNIIYKKDTFNL